MKTGRADAFFWVGNHRGLDLVNTQAIDSNGDRLDLVPDCAELIDWALAAGLIDPDLERRCREAPERHQRDVLAWFRRLRSSLSDVFELGTDASGALDAAVAAVPVRLSYRPDRPPAALPLDTAGPLDQLRLALATAALGAARLDRSRIRHCASTRCVLLFYDTTKNGSRRWCDMRVCGNRAKASAHYRRTTWRP